MTCIEGMTQLATALTLSAVVFTAAEAQAQGSNVGVVSHINVVSDKSEDLSTLEAWRKAYIKPGMSEQDQAIAIFNTLVRYRHQANPPSENGGHVHDPLKTIHVYGYGQCCCVSGEVSGLARYLGMTARGRNITAHSVPEIWYGDAWHLVDCSVMNYFVKPDGALASVDEINQAVREWLKDNPELAGKDKALRDFAANGGWKKGPPLLATATDFYGENGVNSAGWHGWPSTMQEYYKVGTVFEFGSTMGYQLNVQLREGEKITRNFYSRGIEYTNDMTPSYYKELLSRKSLGLQGKLGDQAPARVGDGTIEWDVPLAHLDRVALSVENIGVQSVRGNDAGPVDSNKPGAFVLRFPSSYVYVKGEVQIDPTIRDGGMTISYSDNNGLDWKVLTVLTGSDPHTEDLTELIRGHYDFQLKFELAGKLKIDSIRSTLDFQCSQAALPVVKEGANQIAVNTGPQEGTITLEGAVNPEAAAKGALTIAAFKPQLDGIGENLRLTGGKGEAVFTVETPGDMQRLRFSSHYRARDKRDGFTLSVSFDDGKTWQEADTLPGPHVGMTRYTVFDKVPTRTSKALVKLAGTQSNTTAMFDFRIDADYAEPHGGFQPLQIAYVWTEGGSEKQHTQVIRKPSDTYTINCGPGAVVKSYSVEWAK